MADGGDGVLVLAGTPIGDPADASPRLREELATADVVAAEDTRRLRRLAADLGVSSPAGSSPTTSRTRQRVRRSWSPRCVAGRRVLLVTDAGMPSVSDPGYRLVAAAVDAGIAVTAVPGPSAVLTALALSGLPVDRFCFEGFLPRKAGERARRLAELADRAAHDWCSSRRRTGWPPPSPRWPTAFGDDRPAAVCRELTKTYEEVRRGGLRELADWAADGVRGEITVVVAGAEPAVAADPADLVAEVEALVAAGSRLKEASADVAARHATSRKAVYDAVLAART